MTKKINYKDLNFNSPEFIFEAKSAFNDAVFIGEMKAEEKRLLSIGKQPKYIGGMLELWAIGKIRERLNNPPEEPEIQ